MQESKTLVVRPSPRTLIFYYGVCACISMFFVLLAFLVVLDPKGRIAVSLWVCLFGVISGIGIAGIVAYIHLEIKASTYTITMTEAAARSGLLFRKDNTAQIDSIKSITITQGPVQRFFNVGNLILRTTSHSPLVFWDVLQPETIKEEIWEFVTQASTRSRF